MAAWEIEGVVGTTDREQRRVVATAQEAALVLSAVLVYFGVRALSEGRVDRAFENADFLLRLERALGISWEVQLQGLILGHEGLVALVNWIYIYGHWPVIVVSLVSLYAWRRQKYVLLRDAMIISGLIGFVFFAFVPVAPPRLLEVGLVDTVTQYSHGYRALQPPALTNQYAALPSLHVGWNLLVAIVLFQATRQRAVRVFAVAMPLAMAFAAVATANHFVLDIVVGTLVVLVAFALSIRLEPRTLDEGGPQAGSSAFVAASPVRHRAPLRELTRRPALGGGARRARDRGRRAPLPGAPRGAPPEDARSGTDPLGPLEAREPVRTATRPR
jgi:membrane-associated phospholipid phosphatase